MKFKAQTSKSKENSQLQTPSTEPRLGIDLLFLDDRVCDGFVRFGSKLIRHPNLEHMEGATG